jgi:murein DD-endopeptidase MepM/ murein hydrolase activator NlpD
MTRLALIVSMLALLWLWSRPSPIVVQAQTPATTSPALFSGTKAPPVADWTQRINAGFHAVNCGAWGFQTGCQHWGTDIAGDGEGTPVYAPFSGTLGGCTYNGESGPLVGWWIEYTDDHGGEILINHFREMGDWCNQHLRARVSRDRAARHDETRC